MITRGSSGGGNRVHHILPFSYSAEYCVTRRQGIIDVHDEELRSICVWTSIGHRHRPGLVASLIDRRFWINLVIETTTPGRLAAASRAGWITTLNHEVLDHSMKDDAVVVTALGQGDEVLRSLGCVRFQQLNLNRTLASLNYSCSICHVFSSTFDIRYASGNSD